MIARPTQGSYFRSFSTQLGFFVGLLMYASYGTAHRAWSKPALLLTCLFVGIFIPIYSLWSNKIDEYLSLRTATVTIGRLGRFLIQWAFNIGIFWAFISGNVVPAMNLTGLGGIAGIAFLTTSASQGFQYIALSLANREHGDKNRNVLAALSVNVVVTALSTLGWAWLKEGFLWLGIATAMGLFGLGLLSDVRSFLFPKGGVGVFFGTFNPFHLTHLKLIDQLMQERKLERVYIHATVVPKLHRDALTKGEILIARFSQGMRIYEKTAKADVHVNYFPTGNRFYEFETRCELIALTLQEAGFADRVRVLKLPQVYEQSGFYGVLNEIKKLHPGQPIHGIHGSDLGGMWVRNIYDESGWIYPFAVPRRDQVSATAIRNGARGMTGSIVESILDNLRHGHEHFESNGRKFAMKSGVLCHE